MVRTAIKNYKEDELKTEVFKFFTLKNVALKMSQALNGMSKTLSTYQVKKGIRILKKEGIISRWNSGRFQGHNYIYYGLKTK